ncbi:MAG: DUF2490 domain-containing protein [Flavobacterium sp.]
MKKILFVLLSLVSFKAFSQTTTTNYNIWFHYFGKNRIAERWNVNLEATMRYANGFEEKQQFFIRPSLDYEINSNLSFSAGYSHYVTYSYGTPSLFKINTPEDHVWIQTSYVHKINQWKITHRLRNEFRWVGVASAVGENLEINSFAFRDRLRYMIMFQHPIHSFSNGIQWYGIVGNEAFVNIGTNAGKTLMNQNRVIAGFGLQLDKNQQIQLSYIHQNIWNFANTLHENNPTVRLSYLTHFDWRKKS